MRRRDLLAAGTAFVTAAGWEAAFGQVTPLHPANPISGNRPTVTTLTGSYNGYTINSGFTTISITSSGSIGGTGISGAATSIYTIINSGTINGSTAGVRLNHGGSVTNKLGGTITGSAYGVHFAPNLTGTVVNYGAITGTGTAGIGIDGVSGTIGGTTGILTVTNSGSVSGVIRAIYANSLSLTNASYLSATGTATGVSTSIVVLCNKNSTLSNSGTIKNTGGSPGLGVEMTGGGSFNNSGYLYAGAKAITATTSSVTITNSGTMKAAGTATAIGINLTAGGYVSNSASGTITGTADGMSVSTHAATVTNAGSIIGTGTAGIGVVLSITGNSVNNSGYIGGIFAGVDIPANIAATNITNSGTIKSTGTAAGNAPVLGMATGTTSNLTLTNTATISGVGNGVKSNYLTFYNYGLVTVSGASAAAVYANKRLSVLNTSTIKASGTTGGIGISSINGGSITNSGTASYIFGALDGIKITTAYGTVINGGSIIGTAAGGFGVYATAGAYVHNTGSPSTNLISGAKTGVKTTTTASKVVNAGSIHGATHGVGLYTVHGTVTNTGSITVDTYIHA